jgi:predicted deacylase
MDMTARGMASENAVNLAQMLQQVNQNTDDIAGLENSGVDSYARGKYSTIYIVDPKLPGVLSGGLPITYQAIYALYDPMVDDVYMTKQVLGNDAFGNPINAYKMARPTMTNSFGMRNLRIGILTGLHGNEMTTVPTLHKFLRDIYYNENDNELLNRIKSCVDFYIIPCGNPSGTNAGTRNNGNDVNLNRNFTTNWISDVAEDPGTGPASELETQYIEAWMVANDFDIYIDMHTTMGVNDPWFASNNTSVDGLLLKKYYMKTMSLLSNLWIQREVAFPANATQGTALVETMAKAMSWTHANAIGLVSCTLEIASKVYGDNGGDGVNTLTFAAETIGNFLINIIKGQEVI